MNLLKSITLAATLAVASVASAASEKLIDFTFSGGAAPSDVADNLSANPFVGGDFVAGGSLYSFMPSMLSFTFDVAPGFFADIDYVFYQSKVFGLFSTETLKLNGNSIGSSLSLPFTTSTGFATSITGLTGTNTFTLETDKHLAAKFALDRFKIYGTVSAVPETGTLLLSFGGVALLFLARRRRKMAAQG